MGKEDLKKIFMLSGAAGIVCSVTALFFSLDWALSYFLISSLALANWAALATIFIGLGEKRPLLIVGGLMAKPMLLLLFLVLGIQGLISVATLIAGLNTFFAVMFLYMVANSPLFKKNAAKAATVSETYG
ncbi:MAG: hypothetical protein JJU11_14070 [Candidatus Sumerlaeia bacterium]|nr:hypothetical protein [Candidatus Sumerlaeia bacterium]